MSTVGLQTDGPVDEVEIEVIRLRAASVLAKYWT